MSNFAYKHPFDYHGYPYKFSLPEDLYVEDNQMPEFDVSFMVENPIWGENVGASRLQVKCSESKDDLGDAYENSYLHQDYWYHDHEICFTGFQSEPLCDAQFPMGYHGCPNHVVSGLKLYQPYEQTYPEHNYDKISQVLSTSVASIGKLPNDFDKNSVVGKCIDKVYHSEGTLHEAKDFESYFGRSKNSNLMEKDSAHIYENNVDHFSSGYNAPRKPFEDFPDRTDTCVDYLAQSPIQSATPKQPFQNTSTRAGTEENYNNHPNCWSYGEQLKVELQETISSLTACVGRLEVQVEHLTHQVQEMADKLSGENKLTGPILDHSGESKAVLEEPETISSADETTECKLFIETEDSSRKPVETGWADDSHTSPSDWEII